MSATNDLRSKNLVSNPSSGSITVLATLSATPVLTVKGIDTIDPCSPLELTGVLIGASRNTVYQWNCLNDDTLDSYLQLVSGNTLFIEAGTPQMTTLDKRYVIQVIATDFLGKSSDPVLITIFKSSKAVPALAFSPPSASSYVDQSVFIKGEAMFSPCATEQVDLIFDWSQTAGPAVPASYLRTGLPQIVFPKNVLQAGATYVFRLRATMSNDLSLSVRSSFTLKMLHRPLLAIIDGGSSKTNSRYLPLVLSGANSRDLDLGTSVPQGLTYTWTCSYLNGAISTACRNETTGSPLTFPSTATVTMPIRTFLSQDQPYTMRLTVSKAGRSPVFFEMPVYIVEEIIPSISFVVADGGTQQGSSLRLNSDQRLVLQANSDLPGTVYDWSLSPYVNLTEPGIAPFGVISSTFILQGTDSTFVTGASYVLTVLGSVGSGTGIATLQIEINSPPLGGTFTACRYVAGSSACLKTGAPFDDYRLEAASWSDPDLPLLYEFGYTFEGPNGTVTSWSAGGADTVKFYGGIPTGSMTMMARVCDGLMAKTDIIYDELTIVDTATSGRRLLQAGAAMMAARSKMLTALQTFRPDSVNQLAGAMAVESTKLNPENARAMKGELLANMNTGSARAAKTQAFACEAFGTAALLTALDAAALDRNAVLNSAGLVDSLFSQVSTSPLSLACASQTSATLGATLKAQAAYAKANGVPLLDPAQTNSFTNTLEARMFEVMKQAGWNAIAGEPSRTIQDEGNTFMVTRNTAQSMSGFSLSQPVPSMFSSFTGAAFTIPDSLAADLFGNQTDYNPELDVQGQVSGYAPYVEGFTLRSPLVGLSIAVAQDPQPLQVTNLSKPVDIIIPVDVAGLTLRERMVFSQQVNCVWWSNGNYTSEGCTVTAVSLIGVRCSCTHLTMFAINHDSSIAACGDGKLDPGEECDDGDIFDLNGCSAECKVEAGYFCNTNKEPNECSIPGQGEGQNNVGSPSANGVYAQMSMTGYSSLNEFLSEQKDFRSSLVSSIGNANVSNSDVIVIKACFGASCRTYFTFARRMLAGDPLIEDESQREDGDSGSARKLMATEMLVDFQVNVPAGTSESSLIAAMTASDFLTRFATAMTQSTGKTVTAMYTQEPLAASQSDRTWTRPTYEDNEGYDFPDTEEEQLFENADEATAGLTPTVIALVLGLAAFAFILACCIFYVWPHLQKRREAKYKQTQVAPAGGKKVHPPHKSVPVLAQRPRASDAWDGAENDDDAPATVETSVVEPFGDSIDEANISPVRSDGVRELILPATQSVSPESAQQTPAQRPPGRFGHARARLQELQSQLDQILGTLPKRDLSDISEPTSGDGSAGRRLPAGGSSSEMVLRSLSPHSRSPGRPVLQPLPSPGGVPRQMSHDPLSFRNDPLLGAGVGGDGRGLAVRRVRRNSGPGHSPPAAGGKKEGTVVRRAPVLKDDLPDGASPERPAASGAAQIPVFGVEEQVAASGSGETAMPATTPREPDTSGPTWTS